MLKEKYSNTLGVNYVVLDDSFMSEDGVLFDKKTCSSISARALKELHARSLTSGMLYDYAYAKSTGLKRGKRNFVRETEIRVASTQAHEELPSGEQSVIKALRIIMLLVGLASTIVTGANLYDSLSQSLNKPVALTFAVSMALFLTGSFESFIVFKRKKMYGLATIIIVCFVVTVSYSISCEMEVLYRGFYARDAEFKKETAVDNAQAIAGSEVIKGLDLDIADAEKAVAMSEAEYVRYLGQEKIANWKVTELKNSFDRDVKTLRSLREKKRDTIENAPEAVVINKTVAERVSFIDFVAGIFGWDARKVRFIRDMLPALFIDFISPISVSVAMFIGGTHNGGKRKREEKEGSSGSEENPRRNDEKHVESSSRLFRGIQEGVGKVLPVLSRNGASERKTRREHSAQTVAEQEAREVQHIRDNGNTHDLG